VGDESLPAQWLFHDRRLFIAPPLLDIIAAVWLLTTGLASTWEARLAGPRREWATGPAGPAAQAVDALSQHSGTVLRAATLSGWMRCYAHRRLGLAGLLQACPQAFLHLHIVLQCYAEKDFPGARPSFAAVLVVLGLDAACVAAAAPGMVYWYCLADSWLTSGRWGTVVWELIGCVMYVLDNATDISFVLVGCPLCTEGCVVAPCSWWWRAAGGG
jgi:hypothetical protein